LYDALNFCEVPFVFRETQDCNINGYKQACLYPSLNNVEQHQCNLVVFVMQFLPYNSTVVGARKVLDEIDRSLLRILFFFLLCFFKLVPVYKTNFEQILLSSRNNRTFLLLGGMELTLFHGATTQTCNIEYFEIHVYSC
jgi:hypothetical protein